MKPRYIIAILLVVALLCSSFSMFTFADSTNCVEISNAQELLQYVSDYNSGIKKDAVLTADIVLNDTSDDEWYNADGLTLWVPIKKYANVFDGKGHTIEGIYYNNTTTKTGYEGYGFIEDNGGAELDLLDDEVLNILVVDIITNKDKILIKEVLAHGLCHGDGLVQSGGHAHDAGQVLGAGTLAPLLSAALDDIGGGQPSADIQDTHASRAMELVTGEGQHVDVVVLDMDGQVPHSLDGIGVENHARILADRADFPDGQHGANLVVGEHTGHQAGVLPDGIFHLICGDVVGVLHIQKGDFKALLFHIKADKLNNISFVIYN